MSEQTLYSGSSQQTVANQLGYTSRTKSRVQEPDNYGNKRIVLPYETYQKPTVPQLALNFELRNNKDYYKVREQQLAKRNELQSQSRQQSYAPLTDLIEWKKSRKNPRQQKRYGSEEDINGDKFPEFVVRDDRGFIQSVEELRITVPIKYQRVTKYFIRNPSKQDRATKHYKAQKEEDKPADGYRHYIKKYLYPFLKERGYNVAQVYPVIGGRIWKEVIAPWFLQYYDKSYQAQSFIGRDATSLAIYKKLNKAVKQEYNLYFITDNSKQIGNQKMQLIQVSYVAFWNNKLGEILGDKNDDGEEIFIILTDKAIKEAKLRKDEKKMREQRSYESDMVKIKARKKPTFSDEKTLENDKQSLYDFDNVLDDYVVEEQ
ncbi:MAG: hypothetical protein EZS28_006501 [Streblomastix strix]|uniref:Uncharacterized protein n=1 Tax=Streblomastix strix TaxID=222440 RepID=A0A5J4WU80_9EUKA|nr:MAG: hypothetical protein EZS28_006501 [Streblomastix strix]